VSQSQRNRETVERYFAAINAEDWPALAGVWDPGATVEAVGARARRGIDDIVAFYRRLFEPWAQHHDAPTRVLVDGDAVVAEVRFSGVTHDGRRLEFDAVDVIDLAGARIVKLTNWYDIAMVRKAMAGAATA
jgi:fatty-acyl-CoA synthase